MAADKSWSLILFSAACQSHLTSDYLEEKENVHVEAGGFSLGQEFLKLDENEQQNEICW